MDAIRPVLHHVTMRTSRLEEMIAWYAAVLGAKVMFRDQGAAWMTNDDANHRIAFLSAPTVTDDPLKSSHNAIHHLAFEYGSFDDLMLSYVRLKNEGITPAVCLDHVMTFSLYYKDPEANFVELQADGFEDWKLSGEFMQTPAFASNPVGHFFDAEKVHQAHLSGRDFEAVCKAVRSGEFAPAQVPSLEVG